MADLTADQLAERVRENRVGLVPHGVFEAALVELQTRVNQHDAVERERDVLNDEANDLVRRAEAAEARLAETQKALERITKAHTLDTVQRIARAALTTHHTADG